ncbi:MAG: patatin-like phospholipase family protein [Desulfobacteraceae bacterium]|jgi:hypothetical protein
MKTVLSIDGGGIRGMIPALILYRIETALRQPTCRLFDLIAGTSTGGILALALAKPKEKGSREPAHSSGKLVGLYAERGCEIFSRSLWKGAGSAGGLLDEKYSHGPLEQILWEYLEDTELWQALTHVLISAYDIEHRMPCFFKAWAWGHHALMREAARATSAAPTYFEPARVPISNVSGKAALIDGGVFVNNPAMCAFAEAKRLWPEEEILVVSLGTGELTRPINYEEACGWGLAGWAVPLLNVIFDGASDAVDYQLRQILSGNYVRIQGRLDVASDDMDDASPANIEALRTEARKIMRKHEGDLSMLCDRLRRRK